MPLGLVTYQWGAQWDLPTLIKNLQLSRFEGVELRTEHRHGVEIALDAAARTEVAKRFADSGVELVGFGSTCEFHSPDPAVVKDNIEKTKAWIKLAHDCGATGVKVRPNGLPTEVPVDKTLDQIGRSLSECAAFGHGYGVTVRLEVHGRGTSSLPNVKKIMDAAEHPGATVCWNCNQEDLAGAGIEHNFGLVAKRIETLHIHDLTTAYPWQKLFALCKAAGFNGWHLLEDGDVPADPVRVMKYYRLLWDEWTK